MIELKFNQFLLRPPINWSRYINLPRTNDKLVRVRTYEIDLKILSSYNTQGVRGCTGWLILLPRIEFRDTRLRIQLKIDLLNNLLSWLVKLLDMVSKKLFVRGVVFPGSYFQAFCGSLWEVWLRDLLDSVSNALSISMDTWHNAIFGLNSRTRLSRGTQITLHLPSGWVMYRSWGCPQCNTWRRLPIGSVLWASH